MKKDNIINIENVPLINDIKKQTDVMFEDSGLDSLTINKALEECKQRNDLYLLYDKNQEKELLKNHGIEIRCCHNEPCQHCENYECNSHQIRPVSCMYRMISNPPNTLDYDEYMPSHKEALDMLEKNKLLKGTRAEYEEASTNYGKATSYEERDNTEVKGITMNQARLCINNAIDKYIQFVKNEDFETQEKKDEFESHFDPDVMARNACIEMEKAMGIYPNIKLL